MKTRAVKVRVKGQTGYTPAPVFVTVRLLLPAR